MKIVTNKGIATLPTIMVIGMIALALVVSITAISFNELLISQGSAQSTSALFYAESGARDALLKIARDKNYACTTPDCYSIDFVENGCANNTDCAKITLSDGLGTTEDPKIITSKGVMRASVRLIQVSVTLDGGSADSSIQNGEITSSVWSELTD
jgi:Tfp pilus assembly protein PilX